VVTTKASIATQFLGETLVPRTECLRWTITNPVFPLRTLDSLSRIATVARSIFAAASSRHHLHRLLALIVNLSKKIPLIHSTLDQSH
jgi:hypothetical protein